MKRMLALLLCLAMLLSYAPAMLTFVSADGVIPEDGDISIPITPDDEVEETEPEVTEPEVTEPEVTEPEVTEPEVTEPEVTEPEVTEPEVTEPEATEPEVTEPEVTEPEVTEPEVTEPEVTEPEVTEPEVTEPEVTEPEVTQRVALCAACGEEVVWTPVATGTRISSNNGTHFYLTENCTYVSTMPVISVEAGATVCVDLNGFNLTTATEINVKGILNIQGEGTVGGNIGGGAFGNGGQGDIDFDDLINAGQGGSSVSYDTALINIASDDAVVNIYGGTYSVKSDKPIFAYTAAGKLNLLGGEVKGTVNAGDLTLGGAASAWRVEIAETGKLTVKADWTGTTVANFAVDHVDGLIPAANAVVEGDFTGNLKTPQGRKLSNDNGQLRVKILANNPVQEAALDMEFPKDGSDYVAVCPHCGVEVTWKALSSGRIYKNRYATGATNTHFYIADSYEIGDNNNMGTMTSDDENETMCIHLNGKIIDARGGFAAGKGILNIMGNGTLKVSGTAENASHKAAVMMINHSSATVNLYGGTYYAYASTPYSVKFISSSMAGGDLNAYEGVSFNGDVYAPVGSFVMEKGTVTGTQGELEWTYKDGVLTVEGNGEMTAVDGKRVTWYALNEYVKTFHIGADITGMDETAFENTVAVENIFVTPGNTVFANVEGALYNNDRTELLMVPGGRTGDIEIGAEVTTIASDAFNYTTQLTGIYVDGENPNYCDFGGVLYNKPEDTLIRFPAKRGNSGSYYVTEPWVKNIAPYAFANCTELTAVVLPDVVEEIGEYAFKDAINLESLTLSEDLTVIPAYMCQGCEALTSIVIPNGVTTIETYAFATTGITEATIPVTVTEIGKYAFTRTPLTDVYYGGTEEDWGKVAYEPNQYGVDELANATMHYTEAPAITQTGITVTPPTKVEYWVGEELVLDGMTVTATYSDETTVVLTEGFEVTGFDSETAGVKTITVTHGEFTATFEVTVKEITVTGIEIKAEPGKLVYELGETLDTTGLTITVSYSDGSTVELIEGFEVTGFDAETAGTKTLTVAYEGFTATFDVTVNAAAIVMTGIEVTTLPTKLTYMAGAIIDTKGMVVTATYSDGTTAAITDYTVSADLNSAGTKTVTVTCGELTATFTVEVIASVSISMTAANTAKAIYLSWTDASADKYVVYARSLTGDAWTGWTKIGEPGGLYTNYTGAVAGTSYEFKLEAIKDGMVIGEAYSPTIIRVTATDVNVANDLTGVQVTWEANAAATAYCVYRRAYPGGTAAEWEMIAEVTEAGYLDTNVTNGMKYGYMIRTKAGDDLSAEGTEKTLVYLAAVHVYTIENTPSTIKMTWKANTAAEKYFIYRSEMIDGEWSTFTRIYSHTDLENLVYSDHRGVSNGTLYRYMIRAVKGTQYSVEHSGTQQMRLALTTISATNQNAGVQLSWKPNAAAEKYMVYRSEIVNGGWSPWGQPIFEISDYTEYLNTNDNKIYFYDEDAVNGQRYRYMVRTQTAEYLSGFKSGAALYRLEAPSVTLENINGAIQLTWTRNSAVSKYMIYADVKQPGASKWDGWTYLGSGNDSLTTTTAAVTHKLTMVPGATYRFRVTANMGDNQSAQVVTRQIVYVSYTLAPTAVASAKGITLTLKTNEQTNKFNIERGIVDPETGKVTNWEYLATTVNDATYLDTTAVNGVTYMYRTRAVVGSDLGAAKPSAAIVAKTAN